MRVLRRLWPFLRPHLGLLAVSLTLVAAVAGLSLLPPFLMGWVIDVAFGRGQWSVLVAGALGLVGAAMLQGALRYTQRLTSESVAQHVIFALRSNLYRHLQGLSFGFFDRSRTGELMSRVTSDVDTLRQAMGMGAVNLVQQVVVLIGVVIVLFSKDWALALASLVAFPFLIHAVTRFSRTVRPAHRQVQEEVAALTAMVQENATGIRVVRAFAQEEAEAGRFAVQNRQLRDLSVRSALLQAFWSQYMAFLSACGLVAVLGFGGWRVASGHMTVGDLVAFNGYIMQVVGPVRMMGWLVTMLSRASAGAQRIFEVLDTKSAVCDAPDARPVPPLQGEVRFEDVAFAYDPAAPVLSGVDLIVPAGQKVAVVGLTGSGKSSLVNLIPRFYDPSSGRVTIDGHDLREVTLESVRRQVAVVMQDPFLFSASIGENISYGKPEATAAEVVAAARAAQIDDFVQTLPQGYDTLVGERGIRLSGGQKQRVAIARALLTGAPVVILDESTSSVDVETELRIHAAMDRVVQGRTAIVVAQRLSTIKTADLVVVLEGGRIVARGTHDELLARGGLYRQIYELQFLGVAPGAGRPAEAGGDDRPAGAGREVAAG